MKVLVIGGSSDIGKAIIEERLKMGDEVIYTCSSTSSLEKLETFFNDEKLKAKGVVYNFSNCESDINNVLEILDGKCDALILNAATKHKALKKFHEYTNDYFKENLDENIWGNALIIKSILPLMMNHQFGRIVFVSSVSVDCGTSMYSHYVMTKSAIEQLIMNLAVDYGSENILSNTLRLGLVKTSRTKMFWKRDGYIKRMANIIPIGRLAEVNEVLAPMNLLLGKELYMNGSTLTVSGGMPKVKTSGVL